MTSIIQHNDIIMDMLKKESNLTSTKATVVSTVVLCPGFKLYAHIGSVT